MKTQRILTASALLISMLLSPLGGSLAHAADVPPSVTTVTTDSELIYDPLAQTASIAYERHEDGYTVFLDRTPDSVTMNITAVPGDEGSRAAEKAQLYIHTGVALQPNTSYQVSFSLSAEHAQPEYAVCFDGGSVEAAYGRLDGRSVEAGGTDRVKYQITPEKEGGELVLRLLLGKTEAAGNTLRFSNLAVEEAPENETGENVMLVDKLDYHTPGLIRVWTHNDSNAVITSDEKSATLTVTQAPTQGAEVWKIKLLVATGLKPKPGKTYRIRADLVSTAVREYEVCYNEGDIEKGYDVLYSQKLPTQKQTLDRRIYVPTDKENPGELILQLSLGKLETGDQVTVSNVRVEEAIPRYTSVLPSNFAYDKTRTTTVYGDSMQVVGSTPLPVSVNWAGTSSASASGDHAGELTTSGSSATLKVNGGTELWDARFNIDTGVRLRAGTTYRVNFKIRAELAYSNYEVKYGTALNGVDNNAVYGESKGLTLAAGNTDTVSYMVTPGEDGGLLVSLLVGKTDGRDNAVTVSDLTVAEMTAGAPSGTDIAHVSYPSAGGDPAPVFDPGSFRVRADGIYDGTISGDGSSATMTCTGGDAGEGSAWKRGMFIDDICTLSAGAGYKVSFQIKATGATPYEVCYNKDGDWGADENAFGHADGLTAGTGWSTHEYTITRAKAANGKLRLRLDLGRAAEDVEVTVKNIQVEKLEEQTPSGGTDVASVDYPSATAGAFHVRDNHGSVTGDGSSATMTCAQEGNTWERGLFIDNIGTLTAGNSYEVSFDIQTDGQSFNYNVCYNRNDHFGTDQEKGFGAKYGETASSAKSTVTQTITPDSGKDGKLLLFLEFADANTGTKVTVSNIQVEETGTGNDIASVDYPSMDPGSFRVRDGFGSLAGDGSSVTMTCPSDGASWQRGLYIDDICTISEENSYEVSFDLKTDGNTFNYNISYNKDKDFDEGEKAYGEEYNISASPAGGTHTFAIPSNKVTDGKLRLWLELGAAPAGTQVTVSNIKVVETGTGGTGTPGEPVSASVTYPSGSGGPTSEAGSFEVRSEGSFGGSIVGDGSSATMTCTGGDAGDGSAWKRGMFTGGIAHLSAGSSYEVSFQITADHDTLFDVCYNKNSDWDAGEKAFGGEYDLTATSAPTTVTHTVTADADSTLRLRIDLGRADEDTAVTVSDIQVREIVYSAGAEQRISGFGMVSTEVYEGYTAELTRNSDNAVLKVTRPADVDTATWKAKLCIRTGVVYEANKAYRVKFDIKSENASNNFCVITKGVPDGEDIRGTWGQTIAAGETKTITTRPIPAGTGTGALDIDIELGIFDGLSNTFTVSNVQVEQVQLRSTIREARTEGAVICDIQEGYHAELTRKENSASIRITETPSTGMEAWKVKMFLDTGVQVMSDDSFRVTFDVLAESDTDFEVCYNRDRNEKGYGAIYGLNASGGKVKTVEKVFTASIPGTLKLQLSLGMVKAPNSVTVKNLKVERIAYSYSGQSVLPTEADYSAPGAVSYWAHGDYTTTFTGSADAVTANITAAPAAGVEPWKVKLFLDTGAVLQPGKHYKVTADLTARMSQSFEICYNNGGVEMGYDALGGLQLSGGETQTVEKLISVPADKTDAGSLTLQFNLGRTNAANEITVGGVTVEEVALAYKERISEDFAYTSDSTVSVQTEPDYTTVLESSDDAATLHIISAPATDAAVWKVKLMVHTGAILSAGKTYLVHADLLATNTQGYEVCFNNEEVEKGFDVLYGQTITAGVKTTVERQISVPASMTDAGELVLQFAVGDAVKNDIVVSGVSVQELSYGTGSDVRAVPDTVVGLYDPAGTLDVTREKLTYKTEKLSSEGLDNTVKLESADLRAGELYTVAFTARADKNLTGTFALCRADGAAAVIWEQFELTAGETAYSFTTKDRLSEGGTYDLLWQFGSEANEKLGSADVEISNILVSRPPEQLQIWRSTQNVTVNGKMVTPDAYAINGYNYFKLRDLATLLNDTDAQFAIRYNSKNDSISLTTGKAYSPVGGELTVGEDRSASCVRSTQSITVNGKAVDLKVYTIGWNNYFKLRDLGEALGFQVDYIAESDTVAIASPPTPEAQEKAHDYNIFFLPEIDGSSQPYVGDTMPYYEDGLYYIYYLKNGGDSYNHSVYLTTTKDFVSYTEWDDPVLSASREDVQDNWIGTGSVVKVDGTYYLFYTGFNASGSQEYHEKIMVAKGSTPTDFEKVKGWEIIPPAELGQKNDFRDPQAYYDPATQTISLTVTAAQNGKARILKYTLDKELRNAEYGGIIFTDPTGQFWNLECSDTFRIGDKWYLTYSGQDDTLWYATADSRFGPYSSPVRLDGKVFYAAKHVEDGNNSYMVGWARRSSSASSTYEVSDWSGNIVVQKLLQQKDGSLTLVPVDSIVSAFSAKKALSLPGSEVTLSAEGDRSYKELCTSGESFMLKGDLTYSGTGSFGLAFDFNGSEEQYKLISLDPTTNKLGLSFNAGSTLITETRVTLLPGQKYSFTYIQDGSVGVFYLDGQAALTVRLYGVTDKPIYLFAENNSVTFTSLEQYTL